MKYFLLLISSLLMFSCSEMPNEVPLDSYRSVVFNLDMSEAINNGDRALANELGESAASLGHRYSLSMDGISTVVLGVKNRRELRECVAAEAKGPLESSLITRIDADVEHW